MSRLRRNNLLADDETWLAFLEPGLCEDPSGAQSFAELLFTINEAINRGPDGVKRASDTMLDGIRLVYLFTDAHKAAFKLYLLSLTGHLMPQNEPLILIKGAIERSTAETKRAITAERRSAEQKRKHRASRKKQT
jgi:hypothetical protein